MTNTVSIIEIPVTDFLRAKTFYEIILDITIEEAKMDGVQMGILPGTEETVHVVLAKGKDYQPAITGGPLLYLNAGNNLQAILDKIKQHGGQEIQPKTEISTEMGVFALFTDTEGNKLGLHAAQ